MARTIHELQSSKLPLFPVPPPCPTVMEEEGEVEVEEVPPVPPFIPLQPLTTSRTCPRRLWKAREQVRLVILRLCDAVRNISYYVISDLFKKCLIYASSQLKTSNETSHAWWGEVKVNCSQHSVSPPLSMFKPTDPFFVNKITSVAQYRTAAFAVQIKTGLWPGWCCLCYNIIHCCCMNILCCLFKDSCFTKSDLNLLQLIKVGKEGIFYQAKMKKGTCKGHSMFTCKISKEGINISDVQIFLWGSCLIENFNKSFNTRESRWRVSLVLKNGVSLHWWMCEWTTVLKTR